MSVASVRQARYGSCSIQDMLGFFAMSRVVLLGKKK